MEDQLISAIVRYVEFSSQHPYLHKAFIIGLYGLNIPGIMLLHNRIKKLQETIGEARKVLRANKPK